jgi:hypothetical protein
MSIKVDFPHPLGADITMKRGLVFINSGLLFSAFDESDGVHGDSYARTRGIHFFIGLPFDPDIGDVKARQFRHPAADILHAARQPGTLADHDGVDVDDRTAGTGKFGHRRLEQRGGIGPAPFFIGIGKMRTDVAERGGAQKRVDDGVNKDVGIGMAFESGFAGKFDPAENKAAAILETVGIISDADSQTHGHLIRPS